MFNPFKRKSEYPPRKLTRWHLINIEKDYAGSISWNYSGSSGQIYGSLSSNNKVRWFWRYELGNYHYGTSYSTMEECLEAVAISVNERNSDSDKSKTHRMKQKEAVDEQFTNFISRKENAQS